jgi:hypothetical protein
MKFLDCLSFAKKEEGKDGRMRWHRSVEIPMTFNRSFIRVVAKREEKRRER